MRMLSEFNFLAKATCSLCLFNHPSLLNLADGVFATDISIVGSERSVPPAGTGVEIKTDNIFTSTPDIIIVDKLSLQFNKSHVNMTSVVNDFSKKTVNSN